MPADASFALLRELAARLLRSDDDPPDLSGSIVSRLVPERLRTDEINTLTLFGEDADLYQRARRLIRTEPGTEHLTDAEIEEQLWDFVCTVFLEPVYKDQSRRIALVRAALRGLRRPWDDFDVFAAVRNVSLGATTVTVGKVTFSQIGKEAILTELGWRGGFEDAVLGQDEDLGVVAHLTVSAGTVDRAKERAFDLIDRALDRLVIAVQSSIYVRLWPEDLSFTRSGGWTVAVNRRDRRGQIGPVLDPQPRMSDWSSLAESIAANLAALHIEERPSRSPELGERLATAVHWLARSKFRQSNDEKLVDLFVGLEALLCGRDEGLKASALAVRTMLLADSVDEGFLDPFEVFSLYDLRSDIVHGSALHVASDKDYTSLAFYLRRALEQYARCMSANPQITSWAGFLGLLEAPERIERMAGWFTRLGLPAVTPPHPMWTFVQRDS